MRNRPCKSRVRRPRRFSPLIIVVGDGRKTEYGYFALLGQRWKREGGPALKPLRLTQYGSPLEVVKSAIQRRDAESNYDPSHGDRCYCVLDVEPHDPAKRSPLANALKLASEKDVQVLLSNPSFEFWMLCHVATADELKHGFLDPEAADTELRKRAGVGKEELNKRPEQFEPFVKRAREAVTVAKNVHQTHHHACSDVRKANGCTEVYRLVEYLVGDAEAPP